ncbi:Uncharacterised protein [Mycobacterium tuberculosis]|uniref:Uncharacterized protein n=1 Tax=Mycobacterium tuberculosis TaxID=1773 RepID=A0A655AQJ2_MYCTX|nr:Uncharacterised protein [Mycobacterium tuberculosis]CKU10808.1 Uncharacterised protein [Mycobacterium tuberculosis]CKU31652.1 Uncharacterised protein [Mycobacterium tuberculosis]CKU67672.1 Uncharacterised protein [Mycobacterium tuberculosis]COZ22196.1 Uncharacterised protein [Mycobacterium tuberculosis]
MAALAGAHGDPDGFAFGPVGGPGGEASQPDLRALQVGEHADRAPGGVGGYPDPLIGDLVIVVVAVAEVHSGDVHSGLDQRSDQVVPLGGRPESADDFPASRHDDSA